MTKYKWSLLGLIISVIIFIVFLISPLINFINSFDIDSSLELLDFQAKRELLSLFISKIIVYPASGQGKHDWQKRVKIIWKI